MIKKFFGNLIIIFHIIPLIIILLIIVLLLLNFKINLLISYFILLYGTIVIIGWVIFGYCILTPLENYLLENQKNYNDGSLKSHVITVTEKYLKINETYLYYCIIFITIFLIIFSLLHILIKKYYIKYSKIL